MQSYRTLYRSCLTNCLVKAALGALIAAFVLSGGKSHLAQATSPDLSQYQWHNRLLFLFAPNRSHLSFDALHRSIQTYAAEVADRDLVVFEILESGSSRIDSRPLNAQAANAFREKFSVSPGRFAVILVGKDGGIKLQRQSPTQLEDIFALIDAMPMRREEMRQKSRSDETKSKDRMGSEN